MFFSTTLLRKKGPLGVVWAIANNGRLSRTSILSVNIGTACEEVVHPELPHSLRLQSILVGGIVRVFHKQMVFLLDDAHCLLRRLRAQQIQCQTTLEPVDADQQESRVDAVTRDSRALLLNEILLAANPLEIEIEDEIELMPTNFDFTEDRSSHDRGDSFHANLNLDILGSPDRSSRRHECEDDSPPRMDDLAAFEQDILGPNMPSNSKSTSQTGTVSTGQNDSKSSNDMQGFDANQLDKLDCMSLCSQDLQPIPEESRDPSPAPERRRKRRAAKVDRRTEISSREYRQWLMDASPTLIRPPRKRRRQTNGFPENSSLFHPLVMSNRSCVSAVLREYTRFVKGKIDRIVLVQSQNTEAAGSQEKCAENGNGFEANQFDFEMENGLLPNGIDMDVEFGNLNLEDVGNLHNEGSSQNPTANVDFSHVGGSNDRDATENRNCSDLQTEGKSPGADMEIDRLRTALGSGTHNGSIPLPGSIPRSNPQSNGVSWHSSLLGSSKTRSDGSQRITNLGPRLPGHLPTVQEASIQHELEEGGPCRSLLEETAQSDHGKAKEAINNSTVRVLQVLREKFAEGKSEGSQIPTLSWKKLSSNLNKVEAARFFYQLLVCHANDFIRIEQCEPYGDLTLRAGDKL